jgi:hypothetical protein
MGAYSVDSISNSGGEGGIRTLGRTLALQPLSRRMPSAARPPLRETSSFYGGGRGTRTPKGLRPADFKSAALPIRTSPPKKTTSAERRKVPVSIRTVHQAVKSRRAFLQRTARNQFQCTVGGVGEAGDAGGAGGPVSSLSHSSTFFLLLFLFKKYTKRKSADNISP